MGLSGSWQFFALGSAFFAALTALFGKVGVTGLNTNLATFLRTVVILLVSAALVTARSEWRWEEVQAQSGRAFWFLILSGLATGASWLCYYRALQLGDVSRVASVDKLSVVFVLLAAVLFLAEKPTPTKVLGALLVTLGAAFMAWK